MLWCRNGQRSGRRESVFSLVEKKNSSVRLTWQKLSQVSLSTHLPCKWILQIINIWKTGCVFSLLTMEFLVLHSNGPCLFFFVHTNVNKNRDATCIKSAKNWEKVSLYVYRTHNVWNQKMLSLNNLITFLYEISIN